MFRHSELVIGTSDGIPIKYMAEKVISCPCTHKMMAESKNPWKLLGSKEIYKDKRVRIRADNVIRPNKEKGVYVVVESSPGVIIAAVNENKEVALVRQWRYPQGKEYWELPAGHCDKEEDFLHAAKRELEEEAGILAKKMDRHWAGGTKKSTEQTTMSGCSLRKDSL